jgi:hypothetical protein
MSLKEYKEDFILFLEAGFIAVNQADEDAAVKLFKASELLEPTNMLSRIGMGYLHLHKLELKQAIEDFEYVLQKEPNNSMAKAFLGICKTMTPREVLEGEKLLVEAEKSEDKEVKKLSTVALDFVDKFVKKAPSPVEIRKKEK